MPLTCRYGSGGAAPSGFSLDAVGDSIHEKNPKYCELTALYWLWKNIDADYKGLTHYRRLLARRAGVDREAVLTRDEYRDLLGRFDVVVPTKKRYPFSSVEKHYVGSKKGYEGIHTADIAALRTCMKRVQPGYCDSLEAVLTGNSAHMLNIYAMKGELFDAYCAWLFSVVDAVADELADRPDQRRFIGALSEFLIDVWMGKNQLSYAEVELYEPEERALKRMLRPVLRKRTTANPLAEGR